MPPAFLGHAHNPRDPVPAAERPAGTEHSPQQETTRPPTPVPAPAGVPAHTDPAPRVGTGTERQKALRTHHRRAHPARSGGHPWKPLEPGFPRFPLAPSPDPISRPKGSFRSREHPGAAHRPVTEEHPPPPAETTPPPRNSTAHPRSGSLSEPVPMTETQVSEYMPGRQGRGATCQKPTGRPRLGEIYPPAVPPGLSKQDQPDLSVYHAGSPPSRRRPHSRPRARALDSPDDHPCGDGGNPSWQLSSDPPTAGG